MSSVKPYAQDNKLHDLSPAESFEESDTAPSAGKLERTGDDILAALIPSKDNKGTLSVQALYTLTEDKEKKIPGIDTLNLRLWLLWGKANIHPGTILAKCQYDPFNMIVDPRKIFVAYQATDSRSLSNYSFVVKVRRVDPKTLGREQPDVMPEAASVRVTSLRALVKNLPPRESLLLKVRSENGKQLIDVDQTVIIHTGGILRTGSGHGPRPQEGSFWRTVGEVTPEGIVKTIAEYKVVSSWAIPSAADTKADYEKPSSTPLWNVDLERISTTPKFFNLQDGREKTES